MSAVRKIFVLLISLVLFLVVGVVGAFVLQPRIPVGFLAGPLSGVLSALSGRPQKVAGNWYLTPGRTTILEVDQAEVILSGQSGQRFEATFKEAALGLRLDALFDRYWQFDFLTLRNGRVDASLGSPGDTVAREQPGRTKRGSLPIDGFDSGPIQLSGITVSLGRPGSPPRAIQIGTLQGQVSSQSASTLLADVLIAGHPLNLAFDLKPQPVGTDGTLGFALTGTGKHASALATVNGTFAMRREGAQGSGEIHLSGQDFNDLSELFGKKGSVGHPFSLKGSYRLENSDAELSISEVIPGTEQISAVARLNGLGQTSRPLVLTVTGGSIDLDELANLINPVTREQGASGPAAGAPGMGREPTPIALSLRSLHADLKVDRLRVGGRVFKSICLSIPLEEGEIKGAPFALSSGDHQVAGEYSLSLGGEKTLISARMSMPSLDLGQLFEELQLSAKPADLKVTKVAADLAASGNSPDELWDSLTIAVTAGEGRYLYHDPNSQAVVPITISGLRLDMASGGDIGLVFDGSIGSTPVGVTVDFKGYRQASTSKGGDVSVTADIKTDGARWQLTGRSPGPIGLQGLALQSKLDGESLDSLGRLFNLRLPEIGPYHLSGLLRIEPQGYFLDDLDLRLGETSLAGTLSIDTHADRLTLKADLVSALMQLDDLRAIWLVEGDVDGPGDKVQPNQALETGPGAADRRPEGRTILHREVLNSCDAVIHLSMNRIMSGDRFLGSGSAFIDQSAGRLRVDPLKITLSDGTVDMAIDYEPTVDSRRFRLVLGVADLDYGIIARELKPGSDSEGTLSLRSEVYSDSPSSQTLLEHASGYLRFIVEPERLRSGVIDLWAVNLLSYLLPVLNPDRESKVHCVAGRFQLDDGIMKDEGLLIDTSRIQVKGSATVDFKRQWIDAYLRPIPKRPQFYSLATPIEITGDFGDIKMGISGGGALRSLIRLVTSYIVVPLQWIILNKIPEDGSEYCRQLLDRSAGQVPSGR